MSEVLQESLILGPSVDEITELVRIEAREVGISQKKFSKFFNLLQPLKEHAVEHYAHSLRVGLYSSQLAKFDNGTITRRMAFMGGLGHDIGKTTIDLAVLRAENFGEVEMEMIKKHSRAGFEALKEENLFTAYIAGLHHTFQENSYGISLEEERAEILKGERVPKIVLEAARLVSLADYYDALTTRGKERGREEAFKVMLDKFPNDQKRVRILNETYLL